MSKQDPDARCRFLSYGTLRRCGSLCHVLAVFPQPTFARRARASTARPPFCAPAARMPCVAAHRALRARGLGSLCPGLWLPSDRYRQPPLPAAALPSRPQPHDVRAGWAESSDPAPALTSPPTPSVPTGDLPPSGYRCPAAGLQLPVLISQSGLTDPVAPVPPSLGHLKACAGTLPAGCRPSPESTSDHGPGFPAVPTASTDAAPLPTGHVPRTVPTLEDVLADDEFGAAPSDTPYVADGNPRPDLAADVLRSLHVCNTGLVCYLAYEGLRLSALSSFVGLRKLDLAMRDAPAVPEQRLAALRAHISAAGVDPSFLDKPDYGIPEAFGRVKFAFNEDVSALRTVLAAVDQFVTLADGPMPSPFMKYSPLPAFTEATDWKAGLPHTKQAIEHWAQIPRISKWALSMLRGGFTARPHTAIRRRCGPNEPDIRRKSGQFNPAKAAFVRAKLGREALKGVQKRTSRRPYAVHGIGLVPKAGTKDPWRIVHKMSSFKLFFHKQRFKMDGISTVPTVFTPDHFLFKLDFLAGYHAFLIRPWMRRFFGLFFEGAYYLSKVIPFGFRLSAYWMHRMVKYVISWLRSLGHACVPYLDDGFYGEVGFVRTVRFRNFVVRTWEALGLRFNEKCDLLPFLSEEFLGVVVHLAADVPTFHVPLRKLPSLDVQLHDLLEGDLWHVRKVARVLGVLLSMSCAVPTARLFSRDLNRCLYPQGSEKTEQTMRRDWDSFVTSTPEARAELVWLLTYFRSENQRGFPIFWQTTVRHLADYQLSVDASYRAGGWQMETATAPAPIGRRRRLMLELGCGTGSAGLAFLLDNEDDPDAVVVFVDVHPPAVAFKVFSTYGLARFRARIYYERVAVGRWLDVAAIGRIVWVAWAATLCDIVKIHYSPSCKTLTLAFHWRDSTGNPGNPHRPDGPHCTKRRSALAAVADAVRAGYFGTLGDLLRDFPKMRITVECPRSLFDKMLDVIALLSRTYQVASHRWRLSSAPHCLHSDEPTPSKPSLWLTSWAYPLFQQRCDGQCRWVIPGTRLHQYLISSASDQDPRQRVIRGMRRARIAPAVHQYLDQLAADFAESQASNPAACVQTAGTVRWLPDESAMPQCHRELYALGMAIREMAASPEYRGRRFRVRVDAISTVYYWHNNGGRSQQLTRLLRFVLAQCRAAGVQIVDVVHVSGVRFVEEGVDRLSRPRAMPLNTTADRDHWRLSSAWFELLQAWAAEAVTMDLMAERDNARCPQFFALHLSKDAVGVPDAFANEWPEGLLYCFPPMHLVPSVLRHVAQSSARVLLVVPDWPSQPWWPLLLRLSRRSRLLRRLPDLYERRAEVDGIWKYVAVPRPFFETRVVIVSSA